MFFSDFICINEFYTVIDMSWSKRKERSGKRPFSALSIRLSGDAEFFFENGEKLEARTGDILFMPKNTPYILKANKNEHILCVHFDMPTAMYSPEVFTPENPELFISLFRKACDIWQRKPAGYMFALSSVINTILQNIALEKAKPALQKHSEAYGIFLSAKAVIEKSFKEEGFSVKSVAQKCNISEVYLRKLFVKYLSMPPKSYISKLRVDSAEELLKTGYYTVLEVSQMCGFSDVKHFSKFYKSQKGVSPRVVKNNDF